MQLAIFKGAVRFCTALFLLVNLCACTKTSLNKHQSYGKRCDSTVKKHIKKHSLIEHTYHTSHSKIFSLTKPGSNRKVRIYIEGDGLAWIFGSEISNDPTPTDPVGLSIAMADQTKETVIYLGRPGQYIYDSRLDGNDWTFQRFSQKTIQGYEEILHNIQKKYPDAEFAVFGYSGGGTIALLLAARNKVIKTVITFAGLLDHEAWSSDQNLTPLFSSLNPPDFLEPLTQTNQVHFSGEEDTLIPSKLSRDFLNKFPQNPKKRRLILVPDLNHWNGWPKFWQNESQKWHF